MGEFVVEFVVCPVHVPGECVCNFVVNFQEPLAILSDLVVHVS